MSKTKTEFLTEILDNLRSDLQEIGYDVEKLIIKNKENLCVTVEKEKQAVNVTVNQSENMPHPEGA